MVTNYRPITVTAFAQRLNLDPAPVFQTFLALEMQGLLMRGAFEHPATEDPHQIEWCERRILQRIHRLTLATARKQVEAVAPAVYMRWLLGWQHLAPQTQLSGEEGVLAALEQLEGFEAPAVEWERTLLPARVANYSPAWLDNLCLSGAVGWGRVSPHPAWLSGDGSAPRRVVPTNAAPITFYVRECAQWLPHTLAQQSVDEIDSWPRPSRPRPSASAPSSPSVAPASPRTCSASPASLASKPRTRYGSWPPRASPPPMASTSCAR
jgi:ATP-dependent Lhr-like helicase